MSRWPVQSRFDAMNSSKRIRLGVIGTGAFAEVCHIPGLQSHPQAEIVALCGRRADHARALADRFGIPDVHADFQELCARSDIDAVTIATVNVVHKNQALCAFAHGKHVFCEKPLGMNVSEVAEMVRAAENSRKVHQVAFTFRYNFGIQELRRRLAAGEIGEPFYLRIQYDNWEGLRPDWQIGWREKADIAGGGLVYDVGSHLFDIASHTLGPIESATGFFHHLPRERIDKQSGQPTAVETEDLANCWFRFASGVRGQWFVSRVTPPFAEIGYVEVIGTEGALKAALSRGTIDLLKISRPTAPAWLELPLPPEAKDGQPHALSRMMRSFVEACLRGKSDPDVDASFHDGLAAQQGIAAVLAANAQPRWIGLGDVG
jgi:predicted dehydrogenase